MEKNQEELEFVVSELKKRPSALSAIHRMLDFEKRYMVPVVIQFPSIEKSSDVNEVLENWKIENPEEFNKIKKLWEKCGIGECTDHFVIDNIKQSYWGS